MSTPLRVLLVEDDEDDFLITRELFAEIRTQSYQLDWASTYQLGLAQLDGFKHDVYLVDYRLGEHTGIDLLREANRLGCPAPFILLTGLGARDIDQAAIQAGAADYLIKGQITPSLLERSINHARQRKEIERKLRESEEQYRLLFDENPHPMWVVDCKSLRILAANAAACAAYGYKREEFLSMDWNKVSHHGDRTEPAAAEAFSNWGGPSRQAQHLKKDGCIISVEVTWNRILFQEQEAALVLAIDITQRLDLEAQLRQAQKMESIGTLAGGVAHDFNNILAIISGYSFYLKGSSNNPNRTLSALEGIDKAVKRGASLVRQILTFARKTEVQWEAVELGEIVQEISQLLMTTFPKTISFSINVDGRIPPLLADATQLHQTLLNLCVNARDAMPNGGQLTIRSELLPGSTLQKAFPAATEQAYARLSVTDTGIGMDGTTRSRIFEPFFTTKSREKGTGLGLAVVYGIIKSHHGFIDVESAPGKGTTFHLYLPVLPAPEASNEFAERSRTDLSRGNETILFVEDEDALLDLMKSLLEDQGYNVITARDGLEAIEVFSRNREKVALILCDMGLPNLGGWEACQRMWQIKPNVPCIIASGYIEPNVKTMILNNGANDMIQKPYNPNDLFARMRRVLSEAAVRHTYPASL